jgi:hypothetical protein
VIQLESVNVPAGKSFRFFVLYSGGGTIVVEPTTVKRAFASRDPCAGVLEESLITV